MKKPPIGVYAALVLTGALVTGLLLSRRAAPPAAAGEFDLFFTCDVRGRLVPCGCFSGQYGGLTRLKTVLDQKATTNSIRVDVGDAIRGREDYHRIEYQYLLKAFAALGYDALNIGHREAQLSLADLRAIRSDTPVKLISANLVEAGSTQTIFDPWHIVRRGNLRIALIGVLDPRGMGENIGAGLAVEKMETTLTRVLPELRKQADAIVLLAFTDETTLAQLARDFYEVDVVLGGKVSQPAQKLLKENRSLISYAGNEGRALGWLKVRANAGKGAVQAAGDAITLLEDHIPEHPALVAMAAEYRETVRKAKLAVDDPDRLADNMVPGVRARATYTGSQACIECHASAAIAWKKSGHSDAFASLVDRKADADPSCILCHTVGFGTPSGYRRQFGNTQLTDVGCESCHGPGSVHVRERRDHLATTFKFRPLGAGDCQQCHHGEFSRPFDWDGFWPRIKHGKEPVKTASISGQ